jgi:aspartate kinase
MAAALGAEWCEICSDVDGVYTADPRIVSAARLIPCLSYEETQELAESGAKVLNAQAVEFAKERGIAIYARATASPLPGADPTVDGTVVRRFAPRVPGSVVGVASEREVVMIRSREIDRLLAVMDDFRTPGKQVHITKANSGQNGLTMILSRENLHQEGKLRAALKQLGSEVFWNDGVGAVSIVGTGINVSHQKMLSGARALDRAGIEYYGAATSSFRVTWIVAREKVSAAVEQLHALFIEGTAPLLP